MITRKTILGAATILTAVAGTTFAQSCKTVGATQTAMLSEMGPKGNIAEVAIEAGTFKTLVAALQAADLVDTITGKGPFTVFAPTDEAFAKLPEGTVETLLKPENRDMLRSVLLYHVVPGRAPASRVVAQNQWATANGQRITVAEKGDRVMVDNAVVIKTDVKATNGIIHVIDSVILPESKNIVEVADGAGSFGTLIAAAKAAGLAETLTGEGPFTVFAPTDEAFAALGSTVTDLLKPENKEKLRSILLYHVVPGRVYSDQVVEIRSAKTAQGSSIDIAVNGGTVRVDNANVVATDIEASNGVIHIIDAVILPE